MEMGKRIRKLREARGYNIYKLGELIDMTPSALSKIERGERNPSLKILTALSETFDVTPDYILGHSDKPVLTEVQKQKISLETEKMYEIIKNLDEKERNETMDMVANYVKLKYPELS